MLVLTLSQAFYVKPMEFCSCQPPALGLFSHLWSFNFFILTKSHLLSLNLFISVVTIPISNLFPASQSDVLHQKDLVENLEEQSAAGTPSTPHAPLSALPVLSAPSSKQLLLELCI